MHVKFFTAGRGGGAGPTEYLTDDKVMKDGELIQRDPLPEVLRGDPAMTCALIDSSENTWKYTSGVIAFHADDAPTEEQQQQVMDDFERLAFAGLEPDQYNILWVRHTHEGNTELHMVTPRLELHSGKALNIAPPGHLAAFDALRDAWNHEQGWARPDDPARQRLVSTPENTRNPLLAERKTAREDITNWLVHRVESGLVQDRGGVLESLAEIGEITRSGKDYISIKPEGFDKAIRLKGALYEEEFNAGAIRELAGEGQAGQRADTELAARAASTARAELEKHVGKRAVYNAARYPENSRLLSRNHEREDQGLERDSAGHTRPVDREAIRADEEPRPEHKSVPAVAQVGMAQGDSPQPVSLSAHLGRELGADYIRGEQSRDPVLADQGRSGGDGQSTQEHPAPQHLGGELFDIQTAAGAGRLSNQRRPLGSQIKQLAGASYDRIREQVTGVIAGVRERLDRAREAFNKACDRLRGHSLELAGTAQSLGATVEQFSQSTRQNSRSIQRTDPAFERGLTRMQDNRNDELERFKRDINLAEYASGQGYQLVKNESSRNSFVMQRESDNDKIIVATDKDGHGIYFSVRDDADNGTIIDFVQRRQGLNLGQVRKELRPEIGADREARPIESRMSKPKISTHDVQKAAVNWSRAKPAPEHPHLEKRGISKATLQDPRFAPVIRSDERGNALFAHYNREGISGYEMKNKDFTGFAAGGQKGLWFSSNINRASRVVITESALDALSHAEIQRMKKTDQQSNAYVSLGGSMSPEQKELIASMLEKMHDKGQELALGTDRDAAGQAFNEQLRGLLPRGMEAALEAPTANTKDWNESLRSFQQTQDRVQKILDSAQTRSRSSSRDHGMEM